MVGQVLMTANPNRKSVRLFANVTDEDGTLLERLAVLVSVSSGSRAKWAPSRWIVEAFEHDPYVAIEAHLAI